MSLRHLVAVAVSLTLASAALAPAPLRAADPDATDEADTTAAAPSDSSDNRFQLPPRQKVSASERQRLHARLDAILERRVRPEARVGMYVVDVTTGQVLYERRADEAFNPASNTKLFTSAAALDVFGPDHTFETHLLVESPDEGDWEQPDDGTLESPLYVEGEGEAFLLFEDFVHWAAKLKLRGIDAIEGGIVVDDGAFDGHYLPPAFGQKDEDASYRAPIGAVSVNFNAVSVIVTPADELGMAPDVRLFPPNENVEIDNRARTVQGNRRRCRFTSDPDGEGGTEIVVRGTIGVGADRMRTRLRIDNPPQYAASVFHRALEMVGIEVDGPLRTGDAPGDEKRHVLIRHESQPLSYVVKAMNKWSNNFMAEQLLRTLGRTDDEPSTWKRARRTLRDFLDRAGIDPTGLTLENGSGLYDANRVSPTQVVDLLRAMLRHPSGPEFVSSLAIAGRDGTLRDRMEEGPASGRLRAKTGTLNQVSALSGYVRTQSGRRLAFSMLFNDTPRRGWLYRPVQDELAHALAGFDG
jgi:D-alanyl-D-alanine carboxypeptidase/D-alanyl-D-alanine-endopeptidase (penicillin-binding protein 4)